MEHCRQSTNEHILHAVPIEARKELLRLKHRHAGLLVPQARTRRTDAEIERQELGVRSKTLLERPARPLAEQAPIVRLSVLRPLERLTTASSIV